MKQTAPDFQETPSAVEVGLRLVEGGDTLENFEAKPAKRGPNIPTPVIVSYLPEWLSDGEYRNQSKRTLEGKKDSIDRLIWFLRRVNSTRCGRFEIKKFLIYVKNGHEEVLGRWDSNTARSRKKVGDRTIQSYFVYISGYFQWLVEEEIVEANPLDGLKQPKAAAPKINPLSMEEIAAILDAIRTKGLNRLRNEAIVYFLLDTGIRASELCGLKMEDVDLVRRRCTIWGGKGNKDREVFFGPETGKALKKYLIKHPRRPEQAIFYSATQGEDGLTRSGLLQMLTNMGRLAKLTETRCSPHSFRHTFATEFIRSGGSPSALQLMLGHSNMKMVWRYVTLVQADSAVQHRQHSPAKKLKAHLASKKAG